MPRVLKSGLSSLQLPTLHSCSRLVSRSQTPSQSLHGYARLAVAQHCPSAHHLGPSYPRTFNFRKYFNAHLKFTVYGRKHTSTLQTRFRNAVPLVWGSLRLAPIIPGLTLGSATEHNKVRDRLLENVEHCGGEPEQADTACLLPN